MNFFHHKDLGNHLLQLCPKVVKHPVYAEYLTLRRHVFAICDFKAQFKEIYGLWTSDCSKL